jgi:hypothetical protein
MHANKTLYFVYLRCFSSSLLVSALCGTLYPLRYFIRDIRVHSWLKKSSIHGSPMSGAALFRSRSILLFFFCSCDLGVLPQLIPFQSFASIRGFPQLTFNLCK